MKKKILLVQSNYPGFLKQFYGKTLNWERLGYRQLKNKWNKELFGQADFYSKHLNKLGWKAEEIIINDFKMQSKWAGENNIKITQKPNWISGMMPESIKNYLGLQGWSKKIFWSQVERMRPDVVYMHDLSILSAEEVKRLKRMTKLVAGQIACPLPLNKKSLTEYDLIISSFPHYVEMFRKMGIESEYLRWCFEKSIAKKVKPKERIYDVAFVGGFSPHHRKGNRIFENLAKKVKIDFWGYGVETLPLNSIIRKSYRGQAWGREMYEIFSKSKIVVNRHIGVAEGIANNMRMFEATGMGTLLITDDKPNMEEFFETKKEVVTYKGERDLVSKVQYYLKHKAKREKIAKAGQRKTLSKHTYKARMKSLSKILNKYLDKNDK
jgi:spore maturation protein CgeB